MRLHKPVRTHHKAKNPIGPSPGPLFMRPPVRPPRRRPRRFHLAVIGTSMGALVPLSGAGLYRDFDTGVFLSFVMGMQFTPWFAMEFGVWGSAHEDPVRDSTRGMPLGTAFGQADFRLNLRHGGRAVVPFLLAGVGVGALMDSRTGILDADTNDWVAVGANLRVGTGIEIHTSRYSLVGLRLSLNNLILGAPRGGGTEIPCGDSYLLMLSTEVFLALRF